MLVLLHLLGNPLQDADSPGRCISYGIRTAQQKYLAISSINQDYD